MKIAVLLVFFAFVCFTPGENAVRNAGNTAYFLVADTIAPLPIDSIPHPTVRSKSVQSRDYSYGKNNLLSFVYAVLSVFCLILFFFIGPLNWVPVMIILYAGHIGFSVLGLLKGIKGIKEKKMRILGYAGLITSGCFGVTLLIGLATLALSLFIFLLGG